MFGLIKRLRSGHKEKKDSHERFDRFSSRNKSVFIKREPNSDFSRTEPKRNTLQPSSRLFHRNESTRQSLDNHRAIINLNTRILNQNRELKQSKEYACRRAEYLEEQLRILEDGQAENENQNEYPTLQSAGNGGFTLIDARTKGRLKVLMKDNQELRELLLKSNIHKELLRRQLDMEAERSNALEKTVKGAYNIANEESKKHGDTPAVLRKIQDQLENKSDGIMKLLTNMDDNTKAILNRLDIVGRLPSVLTQFNDNKFDSLSPSVKETMKTLQSFIGERWPELVISLGLTPDLITTLRDAQLGPYEIFWRIMCHWYTSSETVSISALERSCLKMGINIFTEKPMTAIHRTAISNQTTNLVNDGDARMIVSCMKKYMVFPDSLYDYTFASDVRSERMIRFLDSVQVMGDEAFKVLMNSLMDCSFDHLAQSLQEEEARLVSDEIRDANEASRTHDRIYRGYHHCGITSLESQVTATLSSDVVHVDPIQPFPREICSREFADMKASVKHVEAMVMLMTEREGFIKQ